MCYNIYINFKIGEFSNLSGLSINTLRHYNEIDILKTEQALENESKRLNRLRTNIFLFKYVGVPIMNEITIERVKPILIASTRKKINQGSFNTIGETYKSICQWIEKNNYTYNLFNL